MMVNRCAGSCHEGMAHSCMATSKENITVEVMGLQATYRPGRRNQLCTTITVEQDVECACGCNVNASDCTENQVRALLELQGMFCGPNGIKH